jgi:hypothetical protein
MRKFPPEWPTCRAIGSLTLRLGLRPRPEWCQDWELEVCDPSRVREFCDYYETADLDLHEKWLLMSLIIFSYDEYLRETPVGQRDWSLGETVEHLLNENFDLHFHTVEYWCCLENAKVDPDPDRPEWNFHVTAMMRRIWVGCEGERWVQPEC